MRQTILKIENVDKYFYDPIEFQVLKNISFEVQKGDIVLDIGASVGPFTYSILDKKPSHIFCIEPSPIEHPTLEKNTENILKSLTSK